MRDEIRQSPTISSFQDALAFLDKGLDYEKTRTWKYNRRWLNLTRVEQLLEAIGNPHHRLRVIHVAGYVLGGLNLCGKPHVALLGDVG